jgi:hypothetical protein
LLLTAPASEAGLSLRSLLTQAVPEIPVTAVDSADEICFCYEAPQVPLPQAIVTLVGKDPAAIATLAQRVMTRTDVTWSPLPGTREQGG